jgi:hypothetical protein
MMFHAVGLKVMASREIVNEVFETSTNKWKSNGKTDILATCQQPRAQKNFGSSLRKFL